MNKIKILGVPFHTLTMEETLDTLETYLKEHKNHIVVTPNPEGVMQARRNPDFADAIINADLSLADGIGIIMAAKFKRLKIPGRVRGVDTAFGIFERLSNKAAASFSSTADSSGNCERSLYQDTKQEFTVYLLGGEPGVAERAKANIEEHYPGLTVVGFHHGFFGKEKSAEPFSLSEAEIIDEINNLSPDIVLVSRGMPLQELWATKNRHINTRITLCLGGTINILAGDVRLTPPLLRKLGLEWLHRLIRQPSRAKRMLDIPRFVMAVIFSRG